MTVSHEPERQSSFRERARLEREREILAAAQEVFAEHGFEKASMDDIAERVGIGKGTVYLHFASKEDLLVALMRQSCLKLVEACRAAIGTKTNALDRLRTIFQTVVDHRYANERWVSVVATELPVFLGFKQRLSASTELRALIAQVIKEGQVEGVFDRRIRPSMATQALLFLIFVTPSTDGDTPLAKRTFVAAASQLYFRGMSKEAK